MGFMALQFVSHCKSSVFQALLLTLVINSVVGECHFPFQTHYQLLFLAFQQVSGYQALLHLMSADGACLLLISL